MKEMNVYKAEIFSRMEKGIRERKRKRSRILAFSTSLCLCLLIGLGVWRSGFFGRQMNTATEGNSSETVSGDNTNDHTQTGTQVNSDEAPKIDGGVKDVEIVPVDNGLMSWENKTISISLWNALEKADGDDSLKIYPVALANEDDTNFTYNGKTLKEYRDAWDRKDSMLGRLGALLKVGDELKYGETLYIAGTPDGEKWAKELYEETVEMIGNDLLDKYIVNGEFLSDDVIKDSEKLAAETPEIEYGKACDEYVKYRLAGEYQRLKTQGVNAGLSSTGNTLMISVTKEEFENLKFDDAEHWFFTVQKDLSSEAADL